MMHSSLMTLGRLRDCPLSQSAHAIVGTLLEVIGDEGTLVVPTFCFGFCRKEPFDRRKTPSEQMGVLSETVRRWQGSCRSPHPMQSISVVGRHAQRLTQLDPLAAFDESGPFAGLLELDAKLLLLGAPMQAASLVHLAEQRREVPYRYRKRFEGPYIDHGRQTVRTYEMFVRDLELDPRLELERIAAELRACNSLQAVRLGGGTMQLCTAADFCATADRMIAADPWSLVKNPPAGNDTAKDDFTRIDAA